MHKVSIVVVCLNESLQKISLTLDSIIEQTYPAFELIFIDGGSKADTLTAIEKYNKYIDCFLSEPDRGIFDAMNKGISLATGEWINFMNIGDSFENKHVLSNVFTSKINSNTGIIYGDTSLLLSWGTPVLKAKSLNFLLRDMNFVHQSAFVLTSLLKDNLFDIKFRYTADYNFFFTMYKRNVGFQYFELIVSQYDSENSISAKHYISVTIEKAKICGIYTNLNWRCNFLFFTVHSHCKAIFKKLLPNELRYQLRKWNYKRLSK